MPVACPKCGRSVSENLAACYLCGALLKTAAICPKCSRDVPADRTACLYCGTPVAPAPAAAGAPSAAPAPAREFQAAPVAPEATWDANDYVDFALLLLSMPVAVWGVLFLFAIELLTIMKGGRITLFERLANPSFAAFILPGLLALGSSYFLYASSSAESSFFVRWSFPIVGASTLFGVVLLIRRIRRR